MARSCGIQGQLGGGGGRIIHWCASLYPLGKGGAYLLPEHDEDDEGDDREDHQGQDG